MKKKDVGCRLSADTNGKASIMAEDKPSAVIRSRCIFKVNAARKSKVDDNTARMQSIKQLGV